MEKAVLEELIGMDKSTSEIAKAVGKSQTNVCYWLRKYGLKTNFNKYNTGGYRKDTRERIRTEGVIYLCKYCGETDPDKFMKNGKKRSYSRCKSCQSKYVIENYRQRKKEAVIYLGGRCKRCGYDKCMGSLHFHHTKGKDPEWNKMRSWALDRIKKELDKCVLVCANCHGELHYSDNFCSLKTEY
jgi:hypothetical protein